MMTYAYYSKNIGYVRMLMMFSDIEKLRKMYDDLRM